MRLIDDLSKCSGCSICSYICPQKAITMEKRGDGFLYPKISIDKCVNCGLCDSICPFNNIVNSEHSIRKAYGFKHDDSVRKLSSSGGFFSAISDYVLKNGGAVYGAVWTKDFEVKHIRTTEVVSRDRMRSSKYIQSEINEIFDTIEADVSKGKLVLFSGTPCQCAAIYRLLGEKYDNLILVDNICHGVLSDKLFQDYLEHLQKTHNGAAIAKINLRDKRYGWQQVGASFENGEEYHDNKDYFYRIYATHSLQRESCFFCPYAREERIGDFTVGDFWGCKQNLPDFYDELGISLVIINSEKAEKLYSELSKGRISRELRKEHYFSYQPNLTMPTKKGSRATQIRDYYDKYGFEKMTHRFFDDSFAKRVKKRLYKIFKKNR